MQDTLQTILSITEQAEKIPRQYFRNHVSVDHKDDASPVTIADQATEKFIRDALADQFPDHGIIGEEFADKPGNGPYQWIIDPIDGTRSFISGMPLYGMLIALLNDGLPELGIVRMPELSEVFTGSKNGAFLNGTPIKTSATTQLETAFIYINEADKILKTDPAVFEKLNRAGQDRRFGNDCYPHMLVAAGHADACIDYDLKPFDFLPLMAVVQQAGGIITDWNGAPLGLGSDGRVISAATPELHRALLNELKG